MVKFFAGFHQNDQAKRDLCLEFNSTLAFKGV
jgi:hypothetical protein